MQAFRRAIDVRDACGQLRFGAKRSDQRSLLLRIAKWADQWGHRQWGRWGSAAWISTASAAEFLLHTRGSARALSKHLATRWGGLLRNVTEWRGNVWPGLLLTAS